MGQIITTEGLINEDFEQLLTEYLRQFPLPLQKQAEAAMRAFQTKDFAQALELCEELLQVTDVADLKIMQGQCYFSQERWEEALKLFEELAAAEPEKEEYQFHLGMTCHAAGDYQRAVTVLEKLYSSKEYRPFYYTAYGDSLMLLGRAEQAREVFYKEIEHFEDTGTILSAQMVDGAFQNLLVLDLETGNSCYDSDVDSYWRFLNRVTIDQNMQDHLSGTVFLLSHYLSTKAYRPRYKYFIDHLREKNYITEHPYLDILESGFVAWEGFEIHDDRNICALMESLLAFSVEAANARQEGYFDNNSDLKRRIWSYEWYACHYLPDHPTELEYIHDTYPYTYRKLERLVEEIRENAVQAAEKRLVLLMPLSRSSSIEVLRSSMELTYQKALKDQKDPSYVYDGGETYKRIQPKVGRNDPCPCGSGKKYKKCCGR